MVRPLEGLSIRFPVYSNSTAADTETGSAAVVVLPALLQRAAFLIARRRLHADNGAFAEFSEGARARVGH